MERRPEGALPRRNISCSLGTIQAAKIDTHVNFLLVWRMNSLSLALPESLRFGQTVVWRYHSSTDAFLKIFAFISPVFHRVRYQTSAG